MTPRRGWQPSVSPPPVDRASLGNAQTESLVAAWQRLAESERDSVIVATLVTADLARLGAPPEVMGEAARVIEDEVRHVGVCGQVLERLGAAEPVERSPESRRRPPGSEVSLEARCARTLIAGFAVSEPMSASCFAAARRRATEPLTRWALAELLRDEVRHGPFGIRAGGWVIRNWTRAERQALWPACVDEMEQFERLLGGPVLAPPEGGPTAAADAAGSATLRSSSDDLGILSSYDSCMAALACLPRRVLAPLERLGITPDRAALTP